ncbi:MAG: hypothetical protein P4L53_05190 [Candidatus Obscuribacterales bacterium]|nr:hypothetical protein [Candidatus Obscuribacterales bacterium]
MANDSVDSNKVSQDLAALKDKDTLHTAMNDMQALKAKDHLDDPDGKKQTFRKDLDQITKSVDLKGLGLDGFHVTGYAEANTDKGPLQLFQATKLGANPGDKPAVKIVDQDGNLYDVNGTKLTTTKDAVKNVFAAADNQSPAPKDGAPDPAKIADNGVPRTDAAPAPAAAAADNSFGAHGRTFDVGADGKAVYTAKHGDTYWAVARDLLTKPDGTKPSNTEIANQVKALAALNNKSDANKLMAGEPIILPITPPAPPPPEAPAPVPPKDGTVPPKDGTVPPKDGAVPPKDGTVPPKDGTVPPKDAAAPAAPIGFDMKANGYALKPYDGVYNPLSPLGMSGAGVDANQATLAGDAKKPDVNGTVTTQETDMNLKDGPGWLLGFDRTGVKNVDVSDGNILKSRETTYDSAVSIKMAGIKGQGPVELHGVTHIMTTLQADGNYHTDVTAGDGHHNFVTDSSGNVQRTVDQTGKVAVLEAPSAAVLASLGLDNTTPVQPTAVADAGTAKVVAKDTSANDTSAISPP